MAPDPEERVTRGMELMEDLMKRIQTCVKAEETREQLFPPEGKKMSKVREGIEHDVMMSMSGRKGVLGQDEGLQRRPRQAGRECNRRVEQVQH